MQIGLGFGLFKRTGVSQGLASFFLNLSNATNATIADSQGAGTITSVRDAVISSSISVSRTSGVAPLYVNFDYTATTSSGSTNPTHECFFATDFGDPSAGTWANGVQSSGLTSKNAGYGPVTGHVYETPGTYNVTMVVTDGVNTSSRTAQITVQDPDTVYAGALTICISNSNNFTGAPAGATQVNRAADTDMYAAFQAHKASNTRILFCKADTWTCTASLTMTNFTGLYLGGYGTGVAASFGSGTMVSVTPSLLGGGAVFRGTTGNSDVRICNFKITSNRTTDAVSLNGDFPNFMAYKVEIRQGASGFSSLPGNGVGVHQEYVGFCLYECLCDEVYGYPFTDTPFATASGAIGTPGVFTSVAHQLRELYKVRLEGTPPAPLALLTDYFVSTSGLTADEFQLSSSAANAEAGISLALSGTGTCTVRAQPPTGFVCGYIGMTNGGVMGCYFDNSNHGEQTIRIPHIDHSHVTNNYMARPNQSKNVLKIHAHQWGEVQVRSEKFVVSGNVFDMRDGYTIGSYDGSPVWTATGYQILIGNGGNPSAERVRDVILENNFIHGGSDTPRSMLFAEISCPNVTVRNNIADFSLGDRTTSYTLNHAYVDAAMVQTNSSTPEATAGIRVYNNTYYSNANNAQHGTVVIFNVPPTGKTASGAIGTPGIFTAADHGMTAGDKVRLIGAPPTPLATATDYWVTSTSFTSSTFTLAATNGGAALALSGTGSCEVTPFIQVDDVQIKNNVWYLPFHTNANRASNYSLSGAVPTNVTASNNTDNNGGLLTSPGFVATPPVALTDWKPSGYPVNNGATVPVLRDFNMATRSGLYDLGAVLP